MAETKKFLDQEGVQYLWSKVAMEDYPNNDTLIAVLNAIDETKADKDTIPDAYKEYAETTYAKIANLPTKTSQLENDSNFISENDVEAMVTRMDAQEAILNNSVMINKSFGNGPDTVAEGNHTHGDLQLQMQSLEEVINADYYDTSESVDFFTRSKRS